MSTDEPRVPVASWWDSGPIGGYVLSDASHEKAYEIPESLWVAYELAQKAAEQAEAAIGREIQLQLIDRHMENEGHAGVEPDSKFPDGSVVRCVTCSVGWSMPQ